MWILFQVHPLQMSEIPRPNPFANSYSGRIKLFEFDTFKKILFFSFLMLSLSKRSSLVDILIFLLLSNMVTESLQFYDRLKEYCQAYHPSSNFSWGWNSIILNLTRKKEQTCRHCPWKFLRIVKISGFVEEYLLLLWN